MYIDVDIKHFIKTNITFSYYFELLSFIYLDGYHTQIYRVKSSNLLVLSLVHTQNTVSTTYHKVGVSIYNGPTHGTSSITNIYSRYQHQASMIYTTVGDI